MVAYLYDVDSRIVYSEDDFGKNMLEIVKEEKCIIPVCDIPTTAVRLDCTDEEAWKLVEGTDMNGKKEMAFLGVAPASCPGETAARGAKPRRGALCCTGTTCIAAALAVSWTMVARAEFSQAGYWKVENSPRATSAFNCGWEFSLDGLKTVRPVSLPHCIDEGEIGFNASGCVNRQQPAWYRKRFTWKRTRARTFLHFEAVMGKCRVDVNGRRKVEHFGGYLPIHLDVTDDLRDGENEVVVWCDNSDDPSFPPGLVQSGLDFTYFGGIYRDVWLVETGEAYVADPGAGGVFIDTRLGGDGKWTVSADVTIGGATDGATVRLACDGKRVDSPFHPENPSLWSPEAPNLHMLRVEVVRNGRVTDAVGVRFGIRDFEMRRGGFFLNGRKYPKKLIGVNRHQDYLFIGNALPNSLHWRDVKKFKDAGMTVFRSAHYPQDPAFMDACDELGMFVIDATPGWHFWDDSSLLFGQRVYDDIRQMVRRDRSRPSLLLWEPILNETKFPASFATNALAVVKRETNGRGWCTCDSFSDGADRFDVNYQYAVDHGKPLFCREWGDFPDDWDAQNSNSRVAAEWGEGPQVAQARHYRDEMRFGSLASVRADPDLFGATLWHGTDHARGFHPDMFYGGIMTYARRKKYSYYMLQAELTEKPMVFLAHELAPFSPSDFTLYSNCAYTATWLGRPFVPGQTKFVYDELQKTVYYPKDAASVSNGVFVVRLPDGIEERHLPAKRFDHIRMELDTEGLAPVADGSDMVAVTAVLADTNNTAKRYARERIVFEVEGPADIVGENPQETRWGEATVLLRLRARAAPERITVRARLGREGALVRQRGEISFVPGSVEVDVEGPSHRAIDPNLEKIELQQRDFDNSDK